MKFLGYVLLWRKSALSELSCLFLFYVHKVLTGKVKNIIYMIDLAYPQYEQKGPKRSLKFTNGLVNWTLIIKKTLLRLFQYTVSSLCQVIKREIPFSCALSFIFQATIHFVS